MSGPEKKAPGPTFAIALFALVGVIAWARLDFWCALAIVVAIFLLMPYPPEDPE